MDPREDHPSERELELEADYYEDRSLREREEAAEKYELYSKSHLNVSIIDVFKAGAKWHANQSQWISSSEQLPTLIEGEDYSENVLAIVEGYANIQVMCLLYIQEEDESSGYVWANCYGKIDGDAEMDDEYNVIAWMPLPEPPKQ